MRIFLPILLLLALLPTARASDLVRLDKTASITLDGHAELLLDDNGTLTPASALRSTDWQPLPGGLQLGFTSQTVWLRIVVQRAANLPPRWVLRLSNALLDDARLYLRQTSLPQPTDSAYLTNWYAPLWQDAGDGWRQLIAGEDNARDVWPIDYRAPAFPLMLVTDEPVTLLLRLRTKNAMAVGFELWPDAAFGDFSRREALIYGIYTGFCLLLVLLHTAFWRLARAPDSGWYLAYLSTIQTTVVLSAGLPQQLLHLPVWFSDPLLGCSLTTGSLPIGVIFTLRQLQIRPFWPRLERMLIYVSVVIGVCAAGAVLTGHFGIGAPLAQVVSLALICLFIGMATLLWLRGHRPARFFLFAFGIFYLGVIVAYLRNLGVLPANIWTDNATSIGTLLHMLTMSLRVFGHYNRLKRERTAAQIEAFRATRAMNDQLEQQVAERTAELRAALENEQRIRAEQREFVAMVSHEFRTPLAIIDTSAQQIARNPTATDKIERRSRNIRDAAERMLALVDDYLTEDRMQSTATLRLAPCRLDELVSEVVHDWPPQRVAMTPLPTFELNGDRSLLQVLLRNLIVNADRHAPADTTIELRCDWNAQQLQIAVSNCCDEPIPSDERARLFQKYYRGRQATRSAGAGLGLNLVQRIAHQHGGAIELTEGGDNGRVTFTLTLPAPA